MRRLIIAVLALFALVACSSGSAATLSPDKFDELTKQAGVVTLDVRTSDEYASGHLPNAVNMDVESATFSQGISQLDKNATYAVYCRSGNRSKAALAQMSDAGINNAQDLDGGIVSWQAQGLPVVQ